MRGSNARKGVAHLGRPRSEEVKAKISAKLKGKQKHWTGRSHTEETKKKQSDAHIGKAKSAEQAIRLRSLFSGHHHSEETKRRQREAIYSHYLLDIDCNCLGHRSFKNNSPTDLETILGKLLEEIADLEFQRRFTPYTVDYYSPSLHLAFEADGLHWHNAENDNLRDAFLAKEYDLVVVRFSQKYLYEVRKQLC